MNTTIASVVLLLCIAVCTSEGRSVSTEPHCLCPELSGALTRKTVVQIATAQEYKPRPYCNKTEVVAVLKNGSRLCLNPDDPTTKRILKAVIRSQKKRSTTS